MENIISMISENGSKILKWFVSIVTAVVTLIAGGNIQTDKLDENTLKMIEIAGYLVTDEKAAEIDEGFATVGENLGDASETEALREIILSKNYTDGEKQSMVVYNFSEEKYYTVDSDFYGIYKSDDNFRKLGAPTGEKGELSVSGSSSAGEIKEGTYEAQVFEKGVIIKNGDNTEMYVGAVESADGKIILHPILDDQDLLVKRDGEIQKLGNVDGEMHPLKEVSFSRTQDGFKLYANYSSMCVYLELNSDYSIKNCLITAGKNFIKNEKGEYSEKILPVYCISVDEMIKDGSDPVDDDAYEYYKQFDKNGTKEDIVGKFRVCYEDLYKNGFVGGYRCSRIKMWTYMVLDLRFGDGTTGFDEKGTMGRERMTCLVYNPSQDKVYPVNGTFFTVWKEDGDTGRNVLGVPESGILTDENVAGIKYSKVQKFQNGTIALNEKGEYFVYGKNGNILLSSSENVLPDKNEPVEQTTLPSANEPSTNAPSPAKNATAAQMTEIAGYKISESDAQKIISGFAVKGNPLGTGSVIEARREIILTGIYQKDGKSSMVVYNFSDLNYYVVPTELIDKYLVDDNFRKLGAPVSEMGTFNISGKTFAGDIKTGSYKAQIFEKGVLLISGNNIEMHIGTIEKAGDKITVHPLVDDQDLIVKTNGTLEKLGNVDGEMHPLKEIVLVRNSSGFSVYANYSSMCVYLELKSDYSVNNAIITAAKNYIAAAGGYKIQILPLECISIDDMVTEKSEPVSSEALEYYKKYKKDGTQNDIVNKFKDAYKSLYNKGFVPGYRCSNIKMWTYMVLDLRFGDGTTGFDEKGTMGRERMTCLVYNPETNTVLPVYGAYFSIWKEDGATGRNILGCPESEILYNKEINGVTYKEIQIFQNGYIYLSNDGNYLSVTGAQLEENGFAISPTPLVPDRFGAETARKNSESSVYINYQKGAVRCDLSYNKAAFRYSYFPGRQFNLESGAFELSLLSLDSLVDLSALTSEGTMPSGSNKKEISFNDNIKPKLIQKYTELYNNGYFCGFPEEVFKGAWNNVFAQQFVASDSDSMIFGEERPFVSALVYNPKTDSVYLMKDDVIKTWQGVYATAGSPTSDEHQVEGSDAWFQTFDFGMTIRRGNLIVFTEEFDSPEDYVKKMQSNPLNAPTHERDPQKGYID